MRFLNRCAVHRSTNQGSIVTFCYLVVAILVTVGSAALVYSMTEQRAAQQSHSLSHAFQLAEAGIDDAIAKLRDPYSNNWSSWLGTGPIQVSNAGTYLTSVTQDGVIRKIQSTGTATGLMPGAKLVEAWVQRYIPSNFYGNVLYGAGNVDLRGNAYSVWGNVLTGTATPLQNTQNVQCQNAPCITQDPKAYPLPRLSFAQLQQIAQSQGNVYDADRLKKIQQHQDAFPGSFCYSPPIDPNDPSTCVPNVNYITADLVLNGNIGTIGGFFVVVGNVLTNPNAEEDTTINGNGQVAGVIYTTGDFVVNGGGGGLNVDGGVWAGDLARLNGNVTVQYNATYMNAIKNLNINADLQILLWRECPPTGCPSN